MILKGNQRAHGQELALHLLNVADNEHVAIHELRGFVANDLAGAFAEAEAISEGTKCNQYLFSLSLNPPASANVSIEAFERAIDDAERQLGLSGQPRAVVFHEKNGRRHAHCVWSRINVAEMKAINLPHYKRRLCDISQELYQQNNWDMPAGFLDKEQRNQTNYTHAEASQAERAKRDPAKLKALFRTCWEQSDSRTAFAAALRENSFVLARGDRRGFVAVDADGEVYSLSRWCGVKTREVRQRYGDPDNLPTVEQAKQLHASIDTQFDFSGTQLPPKAENYQRDLNDLIAKQREERRALEETHQARWATEQKTRTDSLPNGLRLIWARLSGRYEELISDCAEQAEQAKKRDRNELEALIEKHCAERRDFELIQSQATLTEGINQAFAEIVRDKGAQRKLYAPDPLQPLVLPPDDAPFTKAQIKKNPERIIEVLSDKKERFTRADIARSLADIFRYPIELQIALDEALRSNTLVRIEAEDKQTFTTREFEQARKALNEDVKALSKSGGFAVKDRSIRKAVDAENARLRKQAGATLSDEQVKAIKHVLKPNQMSTVVGLAGAGKSTLLAVARKAWENSGYTVHGAALAGKAADSLETASGIKSRTLASLEANWKNGYEPVSHGDIVVVDEAGMVGTRQLNRIAKALKERGCKLVLVGDPEQLQPIEAGTPFKEIVSDIGAVKLTEVRRQKSDWQRKASQDLAEGRIEAAMNTYVKHGAIHKTQDRDHAIAQLVDDYVADIEKHGTSKSRLALAHRRKDVHAINQGIKAALREKQGAKSETLIDTTHGPRAFAEGDRILFTRNDATLGVRNGMLGTIKKMDGDELGLAIDNDGSIVRSVTLSTSHFPHIEHGFAVSIHRAQGCTVDHSFVLSSTTLDRHLTYVAMTRHRDAANLYDTHKFTQSSSRTQTDRLKRRLVKNKYSFGNYINNHRLIIIVIL